MAFVRDSLVLTQQPSYKAELSKSNEFAKHLVACVVSSARCDVVSGKLVTTVGTVNNVPTKYGLATAASANGANHSLRGAVTGISTGNLTDFCLVSDYVAVGGTVFLYGCGTLGATGSGIALEHFTASNGWAAYDSGMPGSNLLVANESIPTGLQLLMHTRNGSTHDVYRNGVLRNSSSYGNGNAVATEPWGHGSLSSGTIYSTAAKILISGRLSKALTAEEVRRFSENPWQVLEPEDIWIWEPTGSTSDIAASGGVVAGGSADLSVSYSLAAVAVAVAGGSAALNVNVPLSAAALAVAGGSADASATVSIAASALAVAAGTAGLSVTVTLAESGGAVAGGSADLAVSSGDSIAASGGAIASGSALLSATVQIGAAGLAQALGSGALSVEIPLAAFGAAVAGGQATLSAGAAGAGPLILAGSTRLAATLASSARLAATLHGSVGHA